MRRNKLLLRLHDGGEKRVIPRTSMMTITHPTAIRLVHQENERLKMRFPCHHCRKQRFTLVSSQGLLFCSKTCLTASTSEPASAIPSNGPTGSDNLVDDTEWVTWMQVTNLPPPMAAYTATVVDSKQNSCQRPANADLATDFFKTITQTYAATKNRHPTEDSLRKLLIEVQQRKQVKVVVSPSPPGLSEKVIPAIHFWRHMPLSSASEYLDAVLFLLDHSKPNAMPPRWMPVTVDGLVLALQNNRRSNGPIAASSLPSSFNSVPNKADTNRLMTELNDNRTGLNLGELTSTDLYRIMQASSSSGGSVWHQSMRRSAPWNR